MENQTTVPAAVVLAAGKGTRMKSSRAKVLHDVFYRPMLHHVLDAIAPLGADPTVVVVGHQRELVEQAVNDYHVMCVNQEEQRGTGHAVQCTQAALADHDGSVLILCGDSPLLQTAQLAEMLNEHRRTGALLTIMTTTLADPTNYGRIIRDATGMIRAIVEEKDATPEQRRITEINAGLYCVEKSFLFEALAGLTDNNSQRELYLTDIVGIAVDRAVPVAGYCHPEPLQVLGVNSRVELAQAHDAIRRRRNRELMLQGVTMHDPASITVAASAVIGSDCILSERITILGTTAIQTDCRIDPGVVIENAVIGARCRIGANSVLRHCTLAADTAVAPLSRIENDRNNR